MVLNCKYIEMLETFFNCWHKALFIYRQKCCFISHSWLLNQTWHLQAASIKVQCRLPETLEGSRFLKGISGGGFRLRFPFPS
jgi:hypothetical protein